MALIKCVCCLSMVYFLLIFILFKDFSATLYIIQPISFEHENRLSSLNEDQLNISEKKNQKQVINQRSHLILTLNLSEICVPVSMISACKRKGPCCSCCRLAALLSPLRLPAVTELSGTLYPAVLLTRLSVLAAGCKILWLKLFQGMKTHQGYVHEWKCV
jgi:hypothetical protein